MATASESFAAFLERDDDVAVLHAVTKQLGIKNYEVNTGGITDAIALYQGKQSPPYLIIDISKSALPISDMARLREVCAPNVNIIAVGIINEVSLFRDLNKLNIYDYILSPLLPDILKRAMSSLILNKEPEQEATKSGKIIGCVGSRGGVGSTFITANLAAILSAEKLRRIVLLDLDFYFGTLSLNFGVKPNAAIRDAFMNPDRIDQVFLERLVTPINDRLGILSTEVALEEKIQYKIEALDKILKFLVKQYHYVIVDIPHAFDDLNAAAIIKSNILLLVTDPTISGLRDTGRLMHFFQKESAAQRRIMVINKQGQYGHNDLKTTDFEDVIKDKIHHIIPYDVSPVEFINQGKVMTNEKNAVAHAIRNIASDILGIRSEEKEKEGWFSGLFK